MTQPQAVPDRPAPPQGAPEAPRERRLHAARVRMRAFRMKVRARPGWNLA